MSGNTCCLVSVDISATTTSLAALKLTSVGTLLTTEGQVSIRDNNAGGYAIISDGPNGYLYQINGSAPATFVGGVTTGSNTIQLTAQIPIGIAIGMTLSDANGYIPSGTTLTAIDYNTGIITMSSNATGTDGTDSITGNLGTFTRISDGISGAFAPASLKPPTAIKTCGPRRTYFRGVAADLIVVQI